MTPRKKQELKLKRRWRIRRKVVGTPERPRMAVCFTGQHIYVQFVDDAAGRTLAATSTRSKHLRNGQKLAANVKSAAVVGKAAAEVAKAHGISAVVFDRGGARYHGKVKALAEAAREAGLLF